MGGIARENKIKAIAIGGTIDHAHMLISIPAMMPVAKAVQLIKAGSSKWLHENFIPLPKSSLGRRDTARCSLGASQIEDVTAYIAGQEEHHRLRSFQEEYLGFMKQYKIEYDERYVWG